MLNTLKNLNPREIQIVLSRLTTTFLPDPRIQTEPEKLDIDPLLYNKMLEEISDRLNIDPSDPSPTSRSKIFELLFQEMSQTALANVNIQAVKMRVGQKGDLRSDLYEVEFLETFDVAQSHGTRRNHVLEALSKPDRVEHFADRFGDEEIPPLSIFMKTHNRLNPRDCFSLLVLTARKGHIQEVIDAWRIYHSDIDLSKAKNPLDALLAFAETYGYFLNVGLYRAKFFMHKLIEAIPGTKLEDLIEIDSPKGREVVTAFFLKEARLHNVYLIVIAFAIDENKYVADLRKHGVHAEIKNLPWRKLITS